MKTLLRQISQCTVCTAHLPNGVRPVLAASARSRVLIIGQAPGRKVHESGIPWQDQSGENLRAWLGVDALQFYDTKLFALIPMGFCYPGAGTAGDLPPRPECAPLWHPALLAQMEAVRLTLLIGQYSQMHYLGERAGENLTATVRGYREYLPEFLPLPHPSPRNRIWMKKNPWFEKELLPVLKNRVAGAIAIP
ncbi:MAG: uracil-DNA glycosylase family protein [Verrucomicrobiota bacterium]